MFITKLNSNGDTLWTKIQDTTLHWFAYGRSVQQCSDSGYVVGGDCYDNILYNSVYSIMRTDKNGNLLWFRSYGPYLSAYECKGNAITQTPDGKFILIGQTGSNGQLCLIKIKANGDTMWVRHYGDPYPANGECIRQTSDNGYIVVGQTGLPGNGDYNIWLLKIATDTFGIIEQKTVNVNDHFFNATIFNGPLQLPTGKTCRVFDIMGRVVIPEKMKPGIYFIEVDGVMTQKVIKLR
jgi:hypothetical protein